MLNMIRQHTTFNALTAPVTASVVDILPTIFTRKIFFISRMVFATVGRVLNRDVILFAPFTVFVGQQTLQILDKF